MATGKVKWFNDQKGYGFIVPDDGSNEVFVHFSGIETMGYRSLNTDDAVSFDVKEGRGGKTEAVCVCVIA
jgi:CspA family cold shock protein